MAIASALGNPSGTPRTTVNVPQVDRVPLVYREFALFDEVEQAIAVQSAANGFGPDECARRRDVISRRASEPGMCSVGAFRDGQMVGFCYGAIFTRRWSWASMIAADLRRSPFGMCGLPYAVLELHVLPSMWRHGVGTALLNQVHRHTTANWTLLTRKSSSQQARDFYTAQGYVELPIALGRFTVMASELPLHRRAASRTPGPRLLP
ncbi:GNAT family N-acetyltransferase [Streptomyces sp. NPDC005529]|uniref:GNAT family N-acetyltransferase n=1 Tax=unclassified Streptomyces TaxID=2593676 RepID=UPI0033A15246